MRVKPCGGKRQRNCEVFPEESSRKQMVYKCSEVPSPGSLRAWSLQGGGFDFLLYWKPYYIYYRQQSLL